MVANPQVGGWHHRYRRAARINLDQYAILIGRAMILRNTNVYGKPAPPSETTRDEVRTIYRLVYFTQRGLSRGTGVRA